MNVSGLASRRWARVAIVALLVIAMALLVVRAMVDRAWVQVLALIALALVFTWTVKSTVESLTIARQAARQSLSAVNSTGSLAPRLDEVERAIDETDRALNAGMSKHQLELARVLERVEAIEADRLQIAGEFEQMKRLRDDDTKAREILQQSVGELVASVEAVNARIVDMNGMRRANSALPSGPKPEMSLSWAIGSIGGERTDPAPAQVDESKDPGSGGESSLNG